MLATLLKKSSLTVPHLRLQLVEILQTTGSCRPQRFVDICTDAKMASKFRQDLPPEGGYGPINWARKIPKRGLSGAAIFGIFAGVTGLGWTAYYFELQARRKWRLEMNDARLAIEPLLLAEEHRQYLRHCRQTRDAENELMKDVPGWVTGTYYGEKLYNNTDRFPYLHPEGYYALNNPKDMYSRVYERHWH